MKHNHTRLASYIGCVTQAILVNFAPLLFATFQREFAVSLDQLALLITINFSVQIAVDLLAAKFLVQIGHRRILVLAHLFAAVGIMGLGIFPFIFSSAYAGLVFSMVISSIGAGMIEVSLSPLIEALPGKHKASEMSMLHSFFCWGMVGVIALSTLYFNLAGVQNWRYLPMIWAVVPLVNMVFFTKVPIYTLEDKHGKISLKKLFSTRLFFVVFIVMICAGAAEQSMAQWASLFAETGLKVSKTMGDLLGPCAFAALMGVSRTIYAVKGEKIHLETALIFSGIMCVFSYMMVVFSPTPILSLLGCALCGFAVGMMWPGTCSLAVHRFPMGGTAMFAILAFGGALGSVIGPGLVGVISESVQMGNLTVTKDWFGEADATTVGLKTGLLFAIVFAIILAFGVWYLKRKSMRLSIKKH